MAANKPVTINEVARLAQVAKSTASRALSGDPRVQPETRARVEAAARALDFRPSRSARSLRMARTMTLGVMLPDLENPMFVRFLKGVQRVAREREYSLLIADAEVSPHVQAKSIETLFEHRVDGLVLHRSFARVGLLAPFTAAGIPYEIGGEHGDDDRDSERAASYRMFRHLVSLGHRRILFINRVRHDAPNVIPAARDRIESLRRAYCLGSESQPEFLVEWADTKLAAATIVERVFARSAERPTAVVTGSHELSAPALSTIREMGLQIPNDISFVTFGDSDWTGAYHPPISVVSRDYELEGISVTQQLIARITGAKVEATGEAPWEFSDRGSCARVRQTRP